MTYLPKHVKLWEMPSYYSGELWPSWFVFLTRHRDSPIYESVNFDVALKLIGGESETVRVIRERHWAVGWIEWIGIEQSDEEALQKADKIAEKLQKYPILDDDEYYVAQVKVADEYWQKESLRDRIALCGQYGASIFAARRNYAPSEVVLEMFN